ncbi:MAG: hypothetical protein IKF16_03855 [Lachnospiraceae bacterium]|nr:hypothetical protein [Lachnospiraceae bacterium]
MLYIIYNPNSGHGAESAAELKGLLTASETPYSILHADTPADLSGLTAADSIILIGGDGSINRFVNMIPKNYPAPIILMPSGSGNDFARGTGVKKGAANALAVYRSGSAARRLDTGVAQLTGRAPKKFAVSCGIGYDAAVCSMINSGRLKKLLSPYGLGTIAYILNGVKGIFTYKRANAWLTLPDQRIRLKNLAFLSCHCLPYEGGGFAFAPDADVCDGMIDITAVTAANRFIFFLTLAASLVKLHVKLPWVRTFRCHAAKIAVDTPLPFHTDGEVAPDVTSFKVKALPDYLPVRFAPGKD